MDAAKHQIRKPELDIYPKGRKIRVHCSDIGTGGWTRVLDVNELRRGVL